MLKSCDVYVIRTKLHLHCFLSSEFSTLLKNIGASDKMTQGDLDEIFTELGDAELNGEKVISVKSIEADSLLKEIWRK